MKKFMTAFAAIAAGFASQVAAAPIETSRQSQGYVPESEHAGVTTQPSNELVSVTDDKGDEFNFVLKRSPETGVLMAYHSSHSSHRSHASHRSHYSSR